MNEQQRLFVTMIACLSIWLGWQAYRGDLTPPPQAAVSANAPSSAATPVGTQAASASSAAPGTVALPPRTHGAPRSFATPLMRGSMRDGDAGLTQLDLVAYNGQADAQGAATPMSMVAPSDKLPAGMEAVQAAIVWELGGALPPDLAFVGEGNLTLAGTTGNGLQAQLSAMPQQTAYAIDYVLRLTNPTQSPQIAGAALDLTLTPFVEEASSMLSPPLDPLHGVCHVAGGIEKRNAKDLLAKGAYTSAQTATWAGLDRQYFVTAVVPEPGTQGRCTMRAQGHMVSTRYVFAGKTLGPGEVWEQRFSLYAGPKRDRELGAVSPELKSTIDYTLLKVPLGFLARPMVALLNFFHDATASWGVSIMLLTLTIKLLMFPISYKSVLSIRRAAELKPELDKIKIKYEHDRERVNVETLKLYRDRNVNPVGGCLPMLLQMPVWLTLYRTLASAVDLYQRPFLWLPDLTAPEPLPLLAILVGAITVLQQRMTPMAMDNPQAKVMMYVMPIMFTVFMVAMPSGLVLYIMTNSILTIFQQLAINRRAPTPSFGR